MLISLIREGRGVFHFTGELDPYNLQLLHEIAARTAERPGAELRIRLDPNEEALLSERKDWLLELTRGGTSVRVERSPAKPSRESWYETLSKRKSTA